MIFDRYFEPKDDEIIYHYCSSRTLQAILDNESLRFCDLFSMNDSMEMHWGYGIWEEAAGSLIDELGKDFIDDVDRRISEAGRRGLVLACCFSADGDVLSQWRAYSEDGSGYAIGFDAKMLCAGVPGRALKVSYDRQSQIEEMQRIVRSVHKTEQDLPVEERASDDYAHACNSIAYDLAAYKNPSFAEELEIRLIHLLGFETSGNFARLYDPGGYVLDQNGKEVEATAQAVKFLMKNHVPTPYLDLPLRSGAGALPIREIVIGPKNLGLQSNLSVFLETCGFFGVQVRKSRASYR